MTDGKLSDFDYVRNALRRLNPEFHADDYSWTALGRIEAALVECVEWLESRPDFTEGDAATAAHARAVLGEKNSPDADNREGQRI